MSVVQDKLLNNASKQWIAFDALRAATPLRKSLFLEIFVALLLLRWADHAEVEQEAIAVFEDRSYEPLLQVPLQWRHWAQLENPSEMAARLRELAQRLDSLRAGASQPVSPWLLNLGAPLRRALDGSNLVDLRDLVRWVGELPIETPGERRALLETFDQAVADAADPYDGQYVTPANIARLAGALANPQPGERVYDPCFGSGNLLVAAWQLAEQSRKDLRRTGALLEVAGIEINADVFLIGLARMLLAGVESPHLELGDSLEREAPSNLTREGFDVVMANPPIGARASRDPWRCQHFAFRTHDTAGLFVQHALLQLKLHGRAVVAVPEGFLFRGGAERELRRHLVEHGQVEAVVGLPAGAFTPHTNVKGSLLVLSKQGGASRVRMIDAAPLFQQRSGRAAPVISTEIALQLASELRRPELRRRHDLPPGIIEGPPGSAVLSRAVWEVGIEELAAVDWDLSPRRREKGGLDELLANLSEALGETGSVAPLSEVAQVMAGRAIKSTDLVEDPVGERAVGYVRIKDLSQGKVGRPSSWLRPELARLEQRWALLPGDVLVSKSGTIGKTALVRNGAAGAVAANGLYVLRANQDRLDAGYLLAYLASPACQNWLSAQSRGAMIQHLNRAVLDGLQVPLPSLQMQARAAAQFREFGTDVLTFLSQATGASEPDRVTTWLAEMASKTPSFSAGVDDTPPLGLLEPLVDMAGKARRWVKEEQVSSQAARWLQPLTDALISLGGVSQIPPGPSLLNVLQNAEHSVLHMLEHSLGHLPIESQARAIGERLRDWLRAAVADLVDACGLRVRSAPASVAAGSFVEFSVELENEGALPLRSVRVATTPDWGTAQTPYLAERAALAINLRGDVPKQGDQLSLRLNWQARTLAGHAVGGEVELALRVTEPQLHDAMPRAELGGSPYVTGSPLEPQHGHDVFFGREDLIGQISRQIATHGNVVLLEGNRRAGKTSILKHLEGRAAVPGWLRFTRACKARKALRRRSGCRPLKCSARSHAASPRP